MAYQDEVGTRRRLFERLEQCVGRGRIHQLCWNDDGHFRALTVRRQLCEIDELANAIHHDLVERCLVALLVALDRLDQPQVRVRARSRVATARALSAWSPVGTRGLAQQRLGEMQRQGPLADAATALEQERVRPASS